MTDKTDIVIRVATEEDIPHVFSLVEELADYENAADQVTVDIEYYKAEFKKGTFWSIVAEMNGEVVGTCIYYMSFSTWKGRCVYLEDFVVRQKYRRYGVGQMLYDRLLVESVKLKATMIRWQVLDWNDPAVKFYKKNNAVIDKDWWNCKVYF